MNTTKLLIVLGIATASIAANATINLSGAGSFSLAGSYTGLGVTPVYTPASTISSLDLTSASLTSPGSVNQWWFSAVDTSGHLGQITYQIKLSGINAYTSIAGLITADSYNKTTKQVGPTKYATNMFFGTVESLTGSTAATQVIDITTDISAAHVSTAFFKGNIQVFQAVPEPSSVAAMGIGAAGLLIRRRRSK